MYDILYASGIWVCLSDTTHSIIYSYDAFNWTGVDNKTIFSNNGECLVYGQGLFLAGGYGSTHTMAYSRDGINWTGLGNAQSNGIHSSICRAVAFGNDMFVS